MKDRLLVCYFGTYEPEYPRNRIVIDGLQANGVDVVACNVPFWGTTEERVSLASGRFLNARFLWKLVRCYVDLLRKERAISDYDVMLVGYPGQFDMYVARMVSWWRRRPLVFDVLMSLHLILEERGIAASFPLAARLAYWVERGACRLADRIILDTRPHVDYFCRKYRLPSDLFRLAPLGADERAYHPLNRSPIPSQNLRVIYYGKFVPLHGVEHIVEAAHLLRDYGDIQFEFVGEGTTKPAAMATAARYALQNVSFTGWVNKEKLSQHVAAAGVCLGVFGTTQQAFYTVPNKIWEGLAMRKPVITAETPAVCDLLVHGQHLYLCKPADPDSLAAAILKLYRDPGLRERLAQQGHEYWQENFTMKRTGQRFRQYLTEVATQWAKRR
jgi:glycosyltransferase involved in cell wall biosynthesis